jgi:hypothetical protein
LTYYFTNSNKFVTNVFPLSSQHHLMIFLFQKIYRHNSKCQMEYSAQQPFKDELVKSLENSSKNIYNVISDDTLPLIRLLTFDVVNLKFARVIFLMTLILHLVVTLIEIYFSFFVLNLRDNILYGPFFSGMFYVMIRHHFG